jgi:Phospholipase_D-nuclease N-terminal
MTNRAFGEAVAGLPSAAMADLKLEQIVALLVPIVLIQLGLMLFALIDLEREERRVRGGNKIVWGLVIVFLNVIGPILYLTVGREE